MTTPKNSDRRPVAPRSAGWARRIARYLAETQATPNQISIANMLAALLAGPAFYFAGQIDPTWRPLFLSLAALFCQLRLLCNHFDGMLAIEGGKRTCDSAFWGKFSDRVADLLVFVCVGYGIGAPALGWAVGGLALLAAYTRELGHNFGLPSDFSGPMTKQYRMASITSAAALSLWEPLWDGRGQVLDIALWMVGGGAVLTTIRRAARIVTKLHTMSDGAATRPVTGRESSAGIPALQDDGRGVQ